MTDPAPFDPIRGLRVLQEEGVRFVVVGGFAGNVRGAPLNTNDLDICYERSQENMERLVTALRRLQAKLRVAGVDEELPFDLHWRTIESGGSFTFTTEAGEIDVLAFPSGTAGYADLIVKAERFELGDDLAVDVVSLDDLMRMKEASGRTKDRAHLEVLEALRQELRRRG
ncbi:MAG: hypothetical protein WD232_00560 [Acidimicrobiales bacterium]